MMRGGGGGDMKRLKQVHDCRETGLSCQQMLLVCLFKSNFFFFFFFFFFC
jgi:hypothetical protein